MTSPENLFATKATRLFFLLNTYTDLVSKIFDMMAFYSLRFKPSVDMTKIGEKQTFL